MDIQKAKILLEKVNALLKSVSIDADNISNIERDLMLSYIRQLYDAVLSESEQLSTPTQTRTTQKTPATPKPTRSSTNTTTTVPPPPRRINVEPPVPPKTTYEPPRIIKVPDSLADMSQPAPPSPPPVVQTPPSPPQPTPASTPPPTPVSSPKVNSPAVSEEQEGLFEFKVAKELSEKLSERPIPDLTKAFALNDKLLYANELFGKELFVFNESIRELNKMENFAQAKIYLSQLASQYKWTKGNERARIAKDFVKLVRRRYK